MRAALLALCLTACADQQPVGQSVPAGYCENAKPIFVSKLDKLTAETEAQIKAHDETGRKLCGWKK